MSEQEHTLVSKESINTFREVLERYDILFSDISWDAMSFVLRHFLWRNVQRHPALYQDMFNEDDVVQVFEDRVLTSLDVLYANDRLPIHSDDEYDKIVQLVETLFAKDGDNVVDAIYVLLDALTGDGSLDDGAVHTQFVTDNPDAMSVAPSLVDDNGDTDGDADGDVDAQPVTDEPSDETPEQPRDQWADVSVDVDASQDKLKTIEPEIINPADIHVVPDDAIDDDGGSDDDSDDDIPDIVVGASQSEPEPVIESVVQEPVQEPVTVHTLSMPTTPQVPTMHRANMPSSMSSTSSSLSYDARPVHRGRHAAPIVDDNTAKHVDVNKTASDAGLDIDGTAHAGVNERAVRDNVDDYASFVKLLADRKIDEALALARATNRADMLQMIELVRGEERERQAAKHYETVKSIVSDVTADVLADTKDPHVEAMLDAKTQDGDAKTDRDGDSEQLTGTFGFQSTIDMLDDDDDDDDLNIGLYNGASSIIDMDDDDEPDDVMSQPVNEPDDALADDKTVSVDEPALDANASGSTGDIDGVSDVMSADDADDADDNDAGDDTNDDDDDDIIVEPSAGMDERSRLGTQYSDVQSGMHNAIVVSDVSHVIDVEPVASVGESNSDDGKNDDTDGGDAGNDENDNNNVDAQHERIEGDDMDGHDADAQHVVQDMPQHDKHEVAPSDDDNFVNEFDTLLYEDDPVHSPITTLIDAVDGARDDDTSKQASVDASNGDISNDVFADDAPDDINDESLDDAPIDDVPDDIPDTVPDDIPNDIPEDMPDDIDADLPPVQHDGDDDDFDDADDTDETDNPDDTDDTGGDDDDMSQDGTPDAQLDDDVPFGQDEPSDDKEDDDDDDDGAGVDDVPQTTTASTDASHDVSVHDEPDVDADGHDDEHDDVDTPSQVASQSQQTVVTDTTQLELEPVAAPVGYKDTDAVVHQQNMLDILAGLDIDLSNTGHVSVGPFAGTDNKLDKASTVRNPRPVLAKPRKNDDSGDDDNGSNDGNGGRQVSPETLARFKRRNNDSGTGGRGLARNNGAGANGTNVQQGAAQGNVTDPQYDDDAVF